MPDKAADETVRKYAQTKAELKFKPKAVPMFDDDDSRLNLNFNFDGDDNLNLNPNLSPSLNDDGNLNLSA